MSKKPVIVFEGIEGSGKTFHISNVAKYLKKKKIDFIKVREPGGSLNSEKIRKLILGKKSKFNKACKLIGLFDLNKSEWENVKKSKISVPESYIKNKIEERAKAKNNKNFALADKIREELLSKGIVIEDQKGKTIWKVK